MTSNDDAPPEDTGQPEPANVVLTNGPAGARHRTFQRGAIYRQAGEQIAGVNVVLAKPSGDINAGPLRHELASNKTISWNSEQTEPSM